MTIANDKILVIVSYKIKKERKEKTNNGAILIAT